MSKSEGPPSAPEWFDVEALRSVPGRLVVVRRPAAATLVLGSTQHIDVVDPVRAGEAGVKVARRRSGGGAVLVTRDDPVWLDLWIPRGDPLWQDDVARAAEWVGEWWARALHTIGLGGGAPAVHRGASVPGAWSHLVCFAGLGPGEVTVRRDGLSTDAKLVGVAQWRAKQGALFHCAAYRSFTSRQLVELLALSEGQRERLAHDLAASTTDLSSVLPALGSDRSVIEGALLEQLPPGPAWEHRRG
jgi:lipoate-protein ligase A